ncbi:polysaccharide pyruvyl transferase family protein [Helicobacter sp. MIT 21-1697]|uniref:polysaccharide pyruvyl transferase family protein n=1 Tax=Helicobacter sp. MIT 21-1697 TaxID=2993733 RepID=UPI00224B7349|nr:polysaccharide pyruvyl transferase family protein [Helicobacter sp. MIT 21-1697]MCX2716587.1 polysaccharide pyruvyl transferase family protein [Helicobacter sp. MIT 21-1697]
MIFIDKIKTKLRQAFAHFDAIQTQLLQMQILSLKHSIMPNSNAQVQKNHFLLFSFAKHLPQFGANNLGDYIQTIATKKAIAHHFPNARYSFIDRDSLVGYSSGGGGVTLVVMQGWFAYSIHCMPNNETLPIFVGTHFATSFHKTLQYFISYYPWYFEHKEIGCRDLYTLEFCQSLGIKSYFSRCLTLTLPKRKVSVEQNKVFLVGIDKEIHQYIPTPLHQNAVEVNQQWVMPEERLDWQSSYSRAESLLETYKNQAKLVITCALHCAAPCVAMGIPVVLIALNEENLNRFSAVNGILRIWTIKELKSAEVDFNPNVLEIESLKKDMLENLYLSIQKAMGKAIDEVRLKQIRQAITDFKVPFV